MFTSKVWVDAKEDVCEIYLHARNFDFHRSDSTDSFSFSSKSLQILLLYWRMSAASLALS